MALQLRGKLGLVDWKEFYTLLGLIAVIWFLWNTPFVFPLKLLVVFFHELSHGIAAVLTGGRIVEIRLMANEGGLCVTQGGSRFITLSAGYLGSLAFGGVILLAAARSSQDRAVSVIMGSLLLLAGIVWVRPLIGFGFLFSLVAGAGLVASGMYLPMKVNDVLVKVVGLTSCFYALMDIRSDILSRPGLQSDASMLGELTGIPSLMWGLLWILIAAPLALTFLAMATRRGGVPVAT